jgi:integrase
MTAMSYLHRHPRSGIYWFRRGVPADLRKTIGKREIKKSLATTDVREAKTLGMEVATEVDRLFTSARSGVDLSLADAEALAMAWKASLLNESADLMSISTTQREPEAIERIASRYGDLANKTRRALTERNLAPFFVARAKDILAQQGLALPEDSPGFRRLCFAMNKAMIEVFDVTKDRVRGDWRTDSQGTIPVIVSPTLSPLVAPAPRRRRVDGKRDATLQAILNDWAAETMPRPKTLHEWKMTVRRFYEVVGAEVAVRDITKQHAIAFKNAMLKMPRAMSNDLRAKSVPEIVRELGATKVQRVSAGTVQKHFSALNSLMEYAKKHDLADSNPFENMKPANPAAEKERRLSFDADDLRAIFGSPMYRGCLSETRRTTEGKEVVRDAKFWLPLLALYTGARLDELGQLVVADAKTDSGITYLDLNTIDEGKHIKNSGSRRKVPVHPELVRCGFLAYIAEARRKKQAQLFPELKIDKRGVWTGALSVWLNRYLDSIGIKDRRKVFHSFRHSFKDACRDAEIPESVHDALTGHTNGSVGRGYGSTGEPLRVLAKAIAEISYPIDLSHLHDR